MLTKLFRRRAKDNSPKVSYMSLLHAETSNHGETVLNLKLGTSHRELTTPFDPYTTKLSDLPTLDAMSPNRRYYTTSENGVIVIRSERRII